MKAIIDFVCEAKKLVPCDVEGVRHLRERLEGFLKDHRPSRKDLGQVRFVWACIESLEKGEVTSFSEKDFCSEEVGINSLGLSELLYDLGRLLYQEGFDKFWEAFSSNFSQWDQKEIKRHVLICGGNLELIDNQVIRVKSVQGILGYAHILANYYTGSTPYPSIVEVHEVFQDLDFIQHLEEIN